MNSHLRRAIQWLRGNGLNRQAKRAARRRCGPCTLCCTVRGLAETDKPPGVPCEHACAQGCAIYRDRPLECADYFCAWRLGFLRETDRPDLTRVVPDFQVVGRAVAWTIRPGAGAEADTVASVTERLVEELPMWTAVVPFGLPGRERIEAAAPRSPRFDAMIEAIRSGETSLTTSRCA